MEKDLSSQTSFDPLKIKNSSVVRRQDVRQVFFHLRVD